MVFDKKNFVSLKVFHSSVLTFERFSWFDVMFGRYICLTRSCGFVGHSQVICQLP